MSPEMARMLVMAAYEQGWRNACDDHMAQESDPKHPIGQRRVAVVGDLLAELDPYNLLGLRGVK